MKNFHPAADVFPLLDGSAFDSLVEDIRKNGLLFPITMHEGKILDGRNRYRACVKVKVKPRFSNYNGKDPIAFIISSNLERRHLNESQRSMCAARLAEFKHGRPKKNEKDANLRLNSAAKAFKVSPRAVTSALVVKREGLSELVATVDQGKVAVSQASQIARKPEALQKKAVEKINQGMKAIEAMRQIRRELVAKEIKNLPKGKFRVLYADPPWQYKDSRKQGDAGAAEDHYPTEAIEQLKKYRPEVIEVAAPDSVLLCWAPFPLLPDALELVASWGFKYKTAFIWLKDRGFTGNYHTGEAELIIVATRGSCLPEAEKRAPQVHDFTRTAHSRKPEGMRKMIDEQWISGPRIELFRRGNQPKGWKIWGPEAK